MKFNKKLPAMLCTATALSFSVLPLPQAIAQEIKQPNVISIMLDDMGYADLSPYGSEIETPNIQRLADEGIKFTHFYGAPTSTPSRSLFFTGKDTHKVGVGNMEGWARPQQRDSEGEPLSNYSGTYPLDAILFPQLLQGTYHTMMVGKWDQGQAPTDEYLPINRGFDQTFTLKMGGDVHYFVNSNLLQVGGYRENGVPYTDFKPDDYTTTFYTEKALDMLDKRDPNKPFFLNIAHTSPHTPWQAPAEVIEKYIPIYQQGWDEIRKQRFEQQKALGIIPADIEFPPRPEWVPAWDSLSPQEQAYEAKRMAVYAAMIDVIDQTVGQIITYLKDNGLYDNTLILVHSDNGGVFTGSGTPRFLANVDYCVDNSLENMGSPTSFLGGVHGWGSVSNTPFNRYKGDTFEGGIRIPMIISHPLIKTKGVIDSNMHSSMDIAPTILELAGVKYPTYYGGKFIQPMDGVSMASVLEGKFEGNPDRWLAWEMDGVKGVLKGNWKLSQRWLEDENRWDETWYLFNLEEDLGETRNLIYQRPDKFAELMAVYQEYVRENEVIDVNGRVVDSVLGTQMNNQPITEGLFIGGAMNAETDRDLASGRTYAHTNTVEVEGEFNPPSELVGIPADIFVDVAFTPPGETSATKFALTWQGWMPIPEGQPTPTLMSMPLLPRVPLAIHRGPLEGLMGQFDFHFGYRLADGNTFSNRDPLRVTVVEQLKPFVPNCGNIFPWLANK